MSKRRSPRKPSLPLIIAKLGKGKSTTIAEWLPLEKEALERHIVAKFLGALKRTHNLTLSTPTPGSPWPDFETTAGDTKVGIEVVEVVDGQQLLRLRLQERYASRVCELIGDERLRFAGVSIHMADVYDDPRDPLLSTQAAEELAQSLAEGIRAAAGRLESLEFDETTAFLCQPRPHLPRVTALAFRFDPPGSDRVGVIQFHGSRRLSAAPLLQAIIKKVGKRYTRYAAGRLWLLAYDTGFSMEPPPSRAASEAKALLLQRSHPFDEVWYFYPFAGEGRGFVDRIWP